MKKQILLLISTIIFLSSFSSNAQKANSDEKVRIGIIAGGNFNTILFKNYTFDFDGKKLRAGFNIGINTDIKLSRNIYLQSNLFFITKGSGRKDQANLKTDYLEMPLAIVLKVPSKTNNFFFGAGPYFAYGLSGKVEYESGSTANVKFQKEGFISYDPPYDVYFKPFDAGIHALVGYEFKKHFFVQATGQLGLINIAPDYNLSGLNNPVYHNAGFGLSLGYRF